MSKFSYDYKNNFNFLVFNFSKSSTLISRSLVLGAYKGGAYEMILRISGLWQFGKKAIIYFFFSKKKITSAFGITKLPNDYFFP